ncbi:CDP-alcohol phosphatidyltransferase family protein [soil metagenome]
MIRDREAYFDRWATLHGGHDPRTFPPTRIWLGLAHAAARPMARVSPYVVTVAGMLAAGLVPATAARWPLLAAAAVLLSGFLDSLDGAVAIGHGRESRLGFVLDSVADRLSDSAYVVALWVLGAPGWLCVLAGGLAALQEYVRARAGAAGMTVIGVVSVWERPTRVILTAGVLLGCAVAAGSTELIGTLGAAGWVGLGLIGLTQVLAAVHRA